MQDECKQKLGAKSNRICSFNSSESACSSTTKQTPFTSVTTKNSSMQENGHPKNRTCSFNSSETASSSTTKQTSFTRVTTKNSSMQENGHPKKHKAIIPVIISVALSGGLVLILLAIVFVRCRSSRRRFRRYVRPDTEKAVEEGGEATPLQTGINLLCVVLS